MDGQYKRLLLQALFSPSSVALGRALKQQSIDSTALADFLPLLPAGLKARRKLLDNTGSLAVHYEQLREQGWRWLALGDVDYPSLLARIADPPGCWRYVAVWRRSMRLALPWSVRVMPLRMGWITVAALPGIWPPVAL